MEDLALLQDTIDILSEKYPDSIVFIRGDANASIKPRKNNKRDFLFKYFAEENKLSSIPIGEPTYHHFVNNGLSDSNIDVLMYSKVTSDGVPSLITETLEKVICGKLNPLVDSSHDILISSLLLPPRLIPPQSSDNIEAPRVSNTKHKVEWSEEGILEYQELLSDSLPGLQEDYCDVHDPEAVSVLLQVTNHIRSSAAKSTNKYLDLGKPPKNRKPYIPSEIIAALKFKENKHNDLIQFETNLKATKAEKDNAKAEYKSAKSLHQNLVRKHNVSKEIERDDEFNDILSKQPSKVYKTIKNRKSSQSSKLKSLKVGDKTYNEESVADGFYDSLVQLKTLPKVTATSFERFSEDHRHIVEICKEAPKIPKLSESQAEKLLKKIRPSVADFFSITAAHYLNGGGTTIRHFQFIVNSILNSIEVSCVEELNTAHAVILHKGHGKDKGLATSYRTISSCPFISKAIDIYLGDLSKEDWNTSQAETQFQGQGMSHELASLLLTTAIHNSLSSSLPLFVLLLDAKSAFDLVLREILIRRLYLDTFPDQRIRFWDLRLSNRTTYCQWDNHLMGPIRDELGLEQGGPTSSDMYKEYNNEQLTTAQESGLGTTIVDKNVASNGQADDAALMSNDFRQLQHLMDLTVAYCDKYQVQLSAGKTKLLLFSNSETDYVKYAKLLSPITIGDTPIQFVETAEHVGVLRSVSSNLPHIHQRIVSHKKALASILSLGLSRRHRANPLSSLRAETIFGTPVLYSGVATLILQKAEVDILAHHVKETIQNLLKLYSNTPEPVVFFLAGCLPGEALLHLKQLTLFGMICRLPDNILHKIGQELLITASQTNKNWFAQIRTLCFTYNLPHPLSLLSDPPKKEQYKRLLKNNITDFWQSKLRAHCATLTSLKYFKPQFMSLSRPHPMWSSAVNSYQVNKCVVVARMISGRFRCGSLLRHFTPSCTGICELCGLEIEDLDHILIPKCPHLQERRSLLINVARDRLSISQPVLAIFEKYLQNPDSESFVQFLLDPSAAPEIIAAAQVEPTILSLIFRVSTAWCYSLNRSRLKLLGIWT